MKIPTNPSIIYTSPNGRSFKVSGIEKLPETSKWFEKVKKWHWMVIVKFQDDMSFGKLYFDYNDNLYKVTTL